MYVSVKSLDVLTSVILRFKEAPKHVRGHNAKADLALDPTKWRCRSPPLVSLPSYTKFRSREERQVWAFSHTSMMDSEITDICRYAKELAQLPLCCVMLGYGTGQVRSYLLVYFTGTGAIVWLPQCQWSNPERYGYIDHIDPLGIDQESQESKSQQNREHIRWNIVTSSNGSIFCVTGPLCGDSPATGEFHTQRPVTFSLICAWINGWVNNREAGDLRRHRAHYDVIVMTYCITLFTKRNG